MQCRGKKEVHPGIGIRIPVKRQQSREYASLDWEGCEKVQMVLSPSYRQVAHSGGMTQKLLGLVLR